VCVVTDCAVGIMESGILLEGAGSKCFVTYESNILFALRFMVDADMVGASWVEILPGKYNLTREPKTTCQIEIDVMYANPMRISSSL